MTTAFADRKNELKRRAEAYSASLTEEIDHLVGGKSASMKVLLTGVGLLLGLWALSRIRGLSSGRPESHPTENQTLTGQTSSGQSGEAGVSSDYREKLTIVGLEILRRLLLLIIDNLFTRDEKKHL
jgi:hypothetical protein